MACLCLLIGSIATAVMYRVRLDLPLIHPMSTPNNYSSSNNNKGLVLEWIRPFKIVHCLPHASVNPISPSFISFFFVLSFFPSFPPPLSLSFPFPLFFLLPLHPFLFPSCLPPLHPPYPRHTFQSSLTFPPNNNDNIEQRHTLSTLPSIHFIPFSFSLSLSLSCLIRQLHSTYLLFPTNSRPHSHFIRFLILYFFMLLTFSHIQKDDSLVN